MKKFLVRCLTARLYSFQPNEWTFYSAHEVAIFLWGKNPRDYAVYVQAENLPADCEKMERILDHMALDCNTDL